MTPPDEAVEVTRNTVRFWDRNPCDAHPDLAARSRYRYAKEPWLTELLREVSHHQTVVEIGCGQGTDAVTCCRQMNDGAAYVGLDPSYASLLSAQHSAAGCRDLPVTPRFLLGQAETLPFGTGSVPCVVSIGVLHHLYDERRALDEIRRVLRPGGVLYIALYRKASPKLILAKLVRAMGDVIRICCRLTRDRFCNILRRTWISRLLGTMLVECFGVPVMKAYSMRGIRGLFREYAVESIMPVGAGIPFVSCYLERADKSSIFGSYWLVRARK